MSRSPERRQLIGIAVVLSVLTACGSIGSDEDDSIVESIDLSGLEITVGSKDFTEQRILGQLTIEVLQAAGANVQDKTGSRSTAAVRQALSAGAIDMYWEYTGTGWIVILGQSNPTSDPQGLFDAVAQEDLAENDVKWLAPRAPANNAYALAIRSDVSAQDSDSYDEELARVETLSDLAGLIQQNPEKATICVAPEFATRDDGLVGLAKAYGFELPGDAVVLLNEEEVIYAAVDRGEACNFGAVFRTDARNGALGLRLIEDDKGFFPAYNPALTMRNGLFTEHPEIEELFAPIATQLTDETLRELNAAVDVDGRPVRDVVREFLEEEGFLSPRQLSK